MKNGDVSQVVSLVSPLPFANFMAIFLNYCAQPLIDCNETNIIINIEPVFSILHYVLYVVIGDVESNNFYT